MRVLIADDEELAQELVDLVLRRVPDVEVVGRARNGKEAVSLSQRLKPDVIALDLNMPRMNGLEVAEQIRQRGKHPRVVFVSSTWHAKSLCDAEASGGKGFVAQRDLLRDLVPAMRAAAVGKRYYSSSINEWLAKEVRAPAPPAERKK